MSKRRQEKKARQRTRKEPEKEVIYLPGFCFQCDRFAGWYDLENPEVPPNAMLCDSCTDLGDPGVIVEHLMDEIGGALEGRPCPLCAIRIVHRTVADREPMQCGCRCWTCQTSLRLSRDGYLSCQCGERRP